VKRSARIQGRPESRKGLRLFCDPGKRKMAPMYFRAMGELDVRWKPFQRGARMRRGPKDPGRVPLGHGIPPPEPPPAGLREAGMTGIVSTRQVLPVRRRSVPFPAAQWSPGRFRGDGRPCRRLRGEEREDGHGRFVFRRKRIRLW